MKKYHYTYLIINEINGRMYIGVRSSTVIPEEDTGYMGSSKVLNGAINKYGITNFSKFILKEFSTRESAELHERYLLNTYDVGNNPEFYNISVGVYRGGKQGEKFSNKKSGWHHTEEAKKKIAEAGRGRTPSVETIEKLRKFNTGRKSSEETKKKISESKKGIPSWNKGIPHTPEALKKMSEAQKGKKPSELAIQRSREANTGKVVSQETREKLRVTSTGREYSEESRKKMSESHKGKIQPKELVEKRNEAIKKGIHDTLTGTTYNSIGELLRTKIISKNAFYKDTSRFIRLPK